MRRVARQHPTSEACASLHRSIPMMDLVVLAIGFALFALAIGYGYACERL
jgi:hypothetical protein